MTTHISTPDILEYYRDVLKRSPDFTITSEGLARLIPVCDQYTTHQTKEAFEELINNCACKSYLYMSKSEAPHLETDVVIAIV